MANEIPIGSEEIVLTNSPRVWIVSVQWPVIAEVEREDFNASGRMVWSMTVRYHSDGRTLVLGKWHTDQDHEPLAAGELVRNWVVDDPVELAQTIIGAIRNVAIGLDARVPETWGGCFWQITNELIGKLPPVYLT